LASLVFSRQQFGLNFYRVVGMVVGGRPSFHNHGPATGSVLRKSQYLFTKISRALGAGCTPSVKQLRSQVLSQI